MRPLAILVAAMLAASACSRVPGTGRPLPEAALSDSLYWKALIHLDPANHRGSADSALRFLDLYLSSDTTQRHRLEALVLRRLTRDAMQLSRMEAALREARSAESPKPAGEPRKDEDFLKEIQRLKDELAKANAELDRIRKRLAAPKPPG